MKKFAGIIFSTLVFANCTMADTVPVSIPSAMDRATLSSAPTDHDKKLAETVYLSNNLSIAPMQYHEKDEILRCTIDVNYPQIAGENLSPQDKEFNRLIVDKVHAQVQQFKNYVKADIPHIQTLPESIRHNSVNIDYDIDVVKPAKHTLVSVRLSIQGMQAGRAHPYHLHQVLNFDLTKGKTLALKELFKPGASYLKLFAKMANQALSKKLADKWMITAGVAPVAKNYLLWNLDADGILITFEEYQVGSYVDGPQEVRIPYSLLKQVVAPQASIAICVQTPTACVS